MQVILFDLDGTLTDPKEGITKCVQYGMRALGYDEPDLDKLKSLSAAPHEMFRSTAPSRRPRPMGRGKVQGAVPGQGDV